MDIQIEPQFLNTALHGDEVEFFVFPQIEKERLDGEIIRVLWRAKMEFVGTVDKRKGSAISFIVPDDKRMYTDIFISPAESGRVRNNWKVLVRIIKWDDPKKNPEGRIVKVLGKKGDNDAEMESIVLEKGFQMKFPPKVEKEAEL
ncbi:TPA: ribonuclease R, partial [Candidatus Azambacteria bacterium]|nr:ribonuclease R [Candidatus Azambacteria bacterium]